MGLSLTERKPSFMPPIIEGGQISCNANDLSQMISNFQRNFQNPRFSQPLRFLKEFLESYVKANTKISKLEGKINKVSKSTMYLVLPCDLSALHARRSTNNRIHTRGYLRLPIYHSTSYLSQSYYGAEGGHRPGASGFFALKVFYFQGTRVPAESPHF